MPPKKKTASGLGNRLMKDRFKGMRSVSKSGERSLVHTSELNDGATWASHGGVSITEQGDLAEFLSTAELAGTEFVAERQNAQIVTEFENEALPTLEKATAAKLAQEANKDNLRIPRRPPWNREMTAEELQQLERESFLEWRRNLAQLQENEDLLLTPFERNLDFWRQLWRVIERSDVVVQIVDARNPLLFRCEDLENYVKEVDPSKTNLLLINKADMLTEDQRHQWVDYFKAQEVAFAFFSAHIETAKIPDALDEIDDETDQSDDDDSQPDTQDDGEERPQETSTMENSNASRELDNSTPPELDNYTPPESLPVKQAVADIQSSFETIMEDAYKLYDIDELMELFKRLAITEKDMPTIGLVGYPNVGKSSTINAICKTKKVSVSATPGKTKHFQTIHLNDLELCDCPGLVFPNFANTKAELVCNGILPIDQLRDVIPPATYVCHTIPRHILEQTYGIHIIAPAEDEDPDRLPTALEFLNAYSFARGLMNASGLPDIQRGSRIVLKDFVKGKLLYCKPPPGYEQLMSKGAFEVYELKQLMFIAIDTSKFDSSAATMTGPRHKPTYVNGVDDEFFRQKSVGVVVKSMNGSAQRIAGGDDGSSKRHNKKNKREKIRRVMKQR